MQWETKKLSLEFFPKYTVMSEEKKKVGWNNVIRNTTIPRYPLWTTHLRTDWLTSQKEMCSFIDYKICTLGSK